MVERAWLRLCEAGALRDGGSGLRFAVEVSGEVATGFLVRHGGKVRGYLNRCAHVAMELDWQPGQFFDGEGQWLICATHGALYDPASGSCVDGPCVGHGGLRPLKVVEREGAVLWQPDDDVSPTKRG